MCLSPLCLRHYFGPYVVFPTCIVPTCDFVKLLQSVAFVCMCAVLSGVTVSLKVNYEKTRERRRRQEMNEGVEMET